MWTRSASQLIEDRIQSLKLRLEIHKLHVPRGLAYVRFNKKTVKTISGDESEESGKDKLQLKPLPKTKRLQQPKAILKCPVRLANSTELLPVARITNMLERIRFSDILQPISSRCGFPSCSYIFPSLN